MFDLQQDFKNDQHAKARLYRLKGEGNEQRKRDGMEEWDEDETSGSEQGRIKIDPVVISSQFIHCSTSG